MSGFQTRHYLFLLFVLLATSALIWPLHAWISRIEPYVLGLPFSLFWIIAVMLSVFTALVLLYLADAKAEQRAQNIDHKAADSEQVSERKISE